jgi:very-short-patch-repair endonuclease
MRKQLNKLTIGHSTKAERKFAEVLKQLHIKFRTKVRIDGREVDFLIGKYAIDIDGHEQNTDKNEFLAKRNYIPVHYSNKEIYNPLIKDKIKYYDY